MLHRVFLFFLAWALVAPVAALGSGDEVPSVSSSVVSDGVQSIHTKKGVSRCRRSLVRSVVLLLAVTSQTWGHHLYGWVTGEPHLGHGIHLDWPNVERRVGVAERRWFEDPRANQRALAEFFCKELAGDYEYRLLYLSRELRDYFPPARSASSYLIGGRGCEGRRGVCRHKVAVLGGILRHLEIPFAAERGRSPTTGGWHVWIYLPDLDMVADPTAGTVVPAAEYRAGFEGIEPRETRLFGLLNGLY